jgi:hypothetical protein
MASGLDTYLIDYLYKVFVYICGSDPFEYFIVSYTGDLPGPGLPPGKRQTRIRISHCVEYGRFTGPGSSAWEEANPYSNISLCRILEEYEYLIGISDQNSKARGRQSARSEVRQRADNPCVCGMPVRDATARVLEFQDWKDIVVAGEPAPKPADDSPPDAAAAAAAGSTAAPLPHWLDREIAESFLVLFHNEHGESVQECVRKGLLTWRVWDKFISSTPSKLHTLEEFSKSIEKMQQRGRGGGGSSTTGGRRIQRLGTLLRIGRGVHELCAALAPAGVQLDFYRVAASTKTNTMRVVCEELFGHGVLAHVLLNAQELPADLECPSRSQLDWAVLLPRRQHPNGSYTLPIFMRIIYIPSS